MVLLSVSMLPGDAELIWPTSSFSSPNLQLMKSQVLIGYGYEGMKIHTLSSPPKLIIPIGCSP